MAFNYGQSGGVGSALRPARGSAQLIGNSGKFVGTLGQSHAGRNLKAIPQNLQVALFTNPPAVEGGQLVEPNTAAYRRQPVVLQPFGPGLLANIEELVFNRMNEGPEVSHVGIVLGDTALWYGPMVIVAGSAHMAAGATIFERFALKIRWP